MTEKQKLLKFSDSPDAGMPECICSLCEKIIPDGEVPVRLLPRQSNWEMRFHWDCWVKVKHLMDFEIVMKED